MCANPNNALLRSVQSASSASITGHLLRPQGRAYLYVATALALRTMINFLSAEIEI